MKKAFTILIFLIAAQTQAQFYTVKGKVTGLSIEPLPFVSVNVQDQVNHALTNESGEYTLSLENGKYTLIFTYLGYETYKQDVIINNENVILNIILKENQFLLNEVEVSTKYSDPARGMVQQVIKNKNKYIQTAYLCDLYIKAVESKNNTTSKKDSLNIIEARQDSLNTARQLALSDSLPTDKKNTRADSLKISRKHKIFARDGWKHNKAITPGDSLKTAEAFLEDSLTIKNKPLVYDKFNMAEIVIKKSFEYPNKLKEERIGYEKYGDISGLFYLSSTEGEFNFYQNAVHCPSISDMPFQSPLSISGLLMYKYKTIKVYMENGRRIYRIKVEPNLFANSLVSGEMEIVDSLFCLHSFKFHFPKHQLSEYTSLSIESEFLPYDDTLYRISKMSFDYKKGGKKAGSEGHTSVYVENFRYEKGFAKKYFGNEVSNTTEEAYKRDSAFWQHTRKEPLTEKELTFIRIEDSIRVAHESKPYLDSLDKEENKVTFFKIAFSGQSKYNREEELRLSFNPLWRVYQPFGVGGARIRYGVSADKKFKSKKTLSVFTDLNYGILNRDLGGNLSINNLYNPLKRSSWGMGTGRFYDIVNASDTWSAFFRTANYYRKDHISLYHHTELFNGFYWYVRLEYSTRKSIQHLQNDDLTNLILDNGTARPIDFDLYDAFYIVNAISYTPAQKYMREPYEKIVLGSKYPTFTVTHKKGIPHVFSSEVNFDYLEFSVTQDIDFRFLGISKIRFYTGKFHNISVVKEIDYKYQPRVGFPLFANPLSSFQSLEKSYITLDRFYAGHYFHRFNGALINKIPFMKYLRITENAGTGFLLSKEHNLAYFEVYVGIEKNIRIFNDMFRLGFYFVEGKTNNFPYTSGIRFSIDMYDRFRNKWSY